MHLVFTRGLALGEAFCNRIEETTQLHHNILNGTHTLLISPRRYGKTSLALQAIDQEKHLFAHIDLFMKYRRQEIMLEFYDAISQLVSKLIKPTEKTIKALKGVLKHLKITLTLGIAGFELSLTPNIERQYSLKLLLEDLETLLKKHKRNIIIFVDEMQTIVDSDMRDEFEADLRFIAQKTRHMSFIFSGSNRHLLSKIFDDKSRPFYKLCQKMHIDKIAAEHYHKHLQIFAKQQWRQALPNTVLTAITNLTTCHPYYFNILSEKLFQSKKLPDEDLVSNCWQQICYEEQSAISRDLEFLTTKQKQLLTQIAKQEKLKEPTAKDFVAKVDITPKGILDVLQVLYKHSLIEKDKDGFITIVDPVLAYWAK